MKNFFRVLTLFSLTLFSTFSLLLSQADAEDKALAATPETVRELLQVMDLKTMMDQTMSQINLQVNSAIGQTIHASLQADSQVQSLPLAEKEKIQQLATAFATQLLDKYNKQLPKEVKIAEIVEQLYYKLYPKYFSNEELKQLIAFYKSPLGKKVLTVMPSLTADIMHEMMTTIMPKIQALMKRIMQEEMPVFRAKYKDEISKLSSPVPAAKQ